MRYIIPVLLAFASTTAHAQVMTGTATAIDGDTLEMTGARVRLFGIDAPEAGQKCQRDGRAWACGAEATAALQQYVGGKDLTCERRDTDRYGRMVAVCTVNRLDVGQMMVSSGYAVAFTKYSDAYADTEARSKAARIGIWSSDFQMPADYRAAHPSAEPAVRTAAPQPPRRQAAASSSPRGCVIKGNRNRKGEWIYHLPGMPYYDATRAEEMFCTEAQAVAAGYRRAIVRQ